MRLLVLPLALSLILAPTLFARSVTLAQSGDCTGENCPPPSSGHDCEKEKKESTVS